MSFIASLAEPIWRNVALLALAQALAQTLQTMGIATTPLVAWMILGEDKSAVTVPLVFTHLGLMAATFPASMLMAKYGRRFGFSLGAIAGIVSGVTGVAAVYQQSFVLLCLTAFIQGISVACAWFYRFAAADAVAPPLRARAISMVLLGGILSGLLGPEMAKYSKDALAPLAYAGVYVMFGVMSTILLVMLQGITIPPPIKQEVTGPARPLHVIARDPKFLVAVLSSMMGYGVMTGMMASTPIAMQDCGFGFSQSATVIQAHTVSMFAPALFTGWLIQRFGVLTIIGAGAIIQLGCALVAMGGINFYNFLIANMLVGCGWNFCFIGGTTLLTTVYRPSERAKTQAAHDFLEYFTTAVTTGMSGFIFASFGWGFVNLLALPLISVVLVAAAWLFLRQGHVALDARHG